MKIIINNFSERPSTFYFQEISVRLKTVVLSTQEMAKMETDPKYSFSFFHIVPLFTALLCPPEMAIQECQKR